MNVNPVERLILAGLEPFARGGSRDCFVHPYHPDRCVKVARVERAPEILHRQSPWWRRWRKSVHDFDDSFRDYRTLKTLESDNDPAIWRHLPRCFGWVETDRGRGLVIELIRDAEYQRTDVSPELRQRLRT
ncbi:MAG: YrbL family protein [Gammaproteobacteria bacterium]|nr:YrbL family protein [Gammaproteobacteria bacterium]